jgi:hypothetical protein
MENNISFCPIKGFDFMFKYVVLLKHIKLKYNVNNFDIWEIESNSRSIDSIKHDFAILCSNYNISDDTMIEYFDEYINLFVKNQIKNYELLLEKFIIDKTYGKVVNKLLNNENYE